MPAFPHVDKRRVALATGNAGDVYLCHPFLMHAASWPHRGTTPRFVAQPELPPPLELERANADYSAVEIAIRLSLGLHQRS
jgi:hypothetical protein